MTWELKIERLGLHKSGGQVRTYGRYSVLINGIVQTGPGLSGYMCEATGPGANAPAGNGKRIEAGTYPLWTQFGKYRSIGYASSGSPEVGHLPGIALAATGKRVGILIHPAHPPKLFLSSIGCFNPTAELPVGFPMDFNDSRQRTIALIDSLKAYAPQAFAHEVMTRIGDARLTVTGEPMNELSTASTLVESAAVAEPANLPISKSAALKATRWLMDEFGDQLRAAVVGKPYGLKHLCAIACQETAYKWVPWIGTQSRDTIVQRAVYDASGDYPGTSRSAFPVNTAAFRAKAGDAVTDLLIAEANATRALQGWGPKPWVYKGYGLFQYDLQHYPADPDFFRQRQWYDFSATVKRVTDELDLKLQIQHGDLWEAIRAYNGAGPRARQYRDNVRAFTRYCAEVTGD